MSEVAPEQSILRVDMDAGGWETDYYGAHQR